MFKNIGKKIGKFYFGIGGIGDLFLLLASYYDKYYDSLLRKKKTDDDISIIFWANNPPLIKKIIQCIPNHKHVLVTENYLNKPQIVFDYYNLIVSDPMFQGKAHIPDNLKYIDEWTKVENVFEYYGIKRHPQFIRALFYDETKSNNVVLQPYSYDDQNIAFKRREITKENIVNIINNYKIIQEPNKCIIIGSQKELEQFQENSFLDEKHYMLANDIIDAIKYTVSCEMALGVDSWMKTIAGLAGVPTVCYTSLSDPKEFFPTTGYDPGDNIFIKNWNFKIVKQMEIKS